MIREGHTTCRRASWHWRRLRLLFRALHKFWASGRDVQLYGASRHYYITQIPSSQLLEECDEAEARFVLLRKSLIRRVWSAVMYAMLLWTCSISIFETCFVDSYAVFWEVSEQLVNMLCIGDIAISFVSAYRDENKVLVTDLRKIRRQYASKWLIADLLMWYFSLSLPIFEEASGLEDQPRYRLFGHFRLVRLLKGFKDCYRVQRHTSHTTQQSSSNFFKILATYLLLIHIFSCLWYFSARFDNFASDTWVARYQCQDDSPLCLYLDSVYFVFTTLATVGIGDIVPYTPTERCFALILMLLGVGLYSTLISSMTILLVPTPSKLTEKLENLEGVQKITGISKALALRIEEHIRYNVTQTKEEWWCQEQLLDLLPFLLRSEVSLFMHHRLVSQIYFFQDKCPEFIAEIVPKLRSLYMHADQFVYEENTFAEEIYFIVSGRVELIRQHIYFVKYVAGTYFGELDIMWGRSRFASARTKEVCKLLVLKKPDFLKMLDKYSEVRTEVLEVAHIREARNIRAFDDAQGFDHDLEIHAFYQNTEFSHISTTKIKGTSWSILKKENNRIRWGMMKSMDSATDKTRSTLGQSSIRGRPAVSLVSAQQPFVPLELEARLGLVRRKKKAVLWKSSNLETPKASQLSTAWYRLKRYEFLLRRRINAASKRLTCIETKQAEMAALAAAIV